MAGLTLFPMGQVIFTLIQSLRLHSFVLPTTEGWLGTVRNQ